MDVCLIFAPQTRLSRSLSPISGQIDELRFFRPAFSELVREKYIARSRLIYNIFIIR